VNCPGVFARPGSDPEGDLRRLGPCRTFQRRGWPERDSRIILGPLRVRDEFILGPLAIILGRDGIFLSSGIGPPI
jgi:hypothetical protein